jgi:hypothetical protein
VASGVSPALSTGLIIAEMIVRYHIDLFKENLSRKTKLTSQNAAFGWAFIGDQTLRQLTYLTMAASVVFWS